MRYIKKFVDEIKDELESAKEYAEMYVEHKAKNDMPTASKYKEMANDELKHANYIHEWTVKEINELSNIYTPPTDMMEAYEKAHKEYVEKVAWIKQMLSL